MTTAEDLVDGRRARRDRNRDAVVDALLDLYAQGDLNPSVAAVAARSGVSHRSVFRYFADVDDLCRAAIARNRERVEPLLRIHELGQGPFVDRVERFVANRVALFEAIAAPGRVARMRAPLQPIIQADLVDGREFLRHQLRRHFAAELDTRTPEDRADTLAAADVLCSFESYELLRHDHRLPTDEARRVMCTALVALLRPSDGG